MTNHEATATDQNQLSKRLDEPTRPGGESPWRCSQPDDD